jgi:predicted ATPase
MASTIVGTVDDHEARPKPPTLQVIESLRRKRLLLLLDNCEQIVGAAPLVANVLAACPGVSILATSRERLHLRAEQRYRVPPLELPAAVDLFAQRAAAVNVEFTITAANRPTLEAICQRLDHLPLALELCAAQADLFAPAQILAQLHAHPLDLLENGAHDLPPQHRTLRHAIERSYDLLLEHERALFRRLGVFVGGWTVEAVEAVCACAHDAESHAYVSMLHALIGKSLVHAETTPTGERRFLLLETIREYALEYLEASGEVEHLRRQHARYYATFADTAYQTMLEQAKRTGNVPDWDALARQTQPEYANLQAALVWSQTMLGDPEVALQLTNDLADLWLRRGMRHEAIAAMERTLHHPRGIIRSLAQFGVRVDLAQLHALTGNYAAAHMQYAQALALAHELGDTYEYAWTLRSLGWLAREQGDITTARVRLAESLAIFRELDHAYGIAVALYTLAGVAIVEEDPARAEEMLTESRAVAQRTSFPAHDTARILQCLGHVAQLRGAYDRAAALHHESRALFPSDHHTGLLGAYHGLGESALGLGQLDEAAHWLMQGLVLSEALSDRASIAWCLAGLGGVAALSNRPKRAARLWGAAEALRTAICCRSAFAARTTYERALAVARTQLDEEAVAAAWIAGRALLVEQAIAEALQPDALATAPPAAPRGADPAIAETPVA